MKNTKNKKDRITYGAAGSCGVSSGLGFFAVALAHRDDFGVVVATCIAAAALVVLGVAYVQWAVTKW